MINLGKILDPFEFEKYIQAAESFPIEIRKRGDIFSAVDYPHWQKYAMYEKQTQGISFAMNCHNDPLLNEMTLLVAKRLEEIFPEDLPVDPTKIRLVRTIGKVSRHRDEGGRLSCINIGLRNSSKGITRFGVDDRLETFDANHKDYRVEEGYAYLVNTGILHEVIGSFEPRYLITYGFHNTTYDAIVQRFGK